MITIGGSGDEEARAVSETVGFVLVFALVTTVIAVTFTFGLGGLEDAQLAERDTNVERAFDVLHDNLRDISRDGVPSRATELRLAGGTLTLAERTEVRFNGTAVDEGYTEGTRPLVYRGAGDSAVVYENGAVFVTQGDRGSVLNGPDLLVDDDGVVVSLVRLSGSGQSIAGDRTVLVVGSNAERRVVDSPWSGGNVTMDIDSTHADVWESYYTDLAAEYGEDTGAGHPRVHVEEEAVETCAADTGGGDGDLTVCFELEPDQEFVVHQTTIAVEFSD